MERNVTDHHVGFLKRRAKALAKETGIPHHAALDKAAQAEGFANWSHFLKSGKRRPPSSINIGQSNTRIPDRSRAIIAVPNPSITVRVARRLESAPFSAIREGAAVQREAALNALQRIANADVRAEREMDVILASKEAESKSFLACWEKLAVEAPELLLATRLKELRDELDREIDGVFISFQSRQYIDGTLRAMRTRSAGNPGAYSRVLATATPKVLALKARMHREIQDMGRK
jgi:hypothetical protein